MRQAGQQDPRTFRRYYQPSNGGVDGQGTFLRKKRREVVSDVFRELSIPYNPNLSQRLPTHAKYHLERGEEHMALEKEIASLTGNRDSESRNRLKMLRQKKRDILDTALKLWQTQQPYKPNDQPEYHRALFERVRFMMPERDRLSRDLFRVARLRDPLGLSVLRDMMSLYRQTSEVEFRPGLERDKCCCPKKEENNQYESCKSCDEYDWKHIYDCYRKECSNIHGFADLCFLCNEWVFGKEQLARPLPQPFRRFEHVSDFLRPPSPRRSSCQSGILSVLPRKRNARASRQDTPVPAPDKVAGAPPATY
jgi:hypothetical protein